MLYIKTNQFNVGYSSFLTAFPVRINYGIDQKLPTVSRTCHERCSDLPHAARISKAHCQHTHKRLGCHRLFNTNANQLFRCFHPSDHFKNTDYPGKIRKPVTPLVTSSVPDSRDAFTDQPERT